MRDHDSVAQRQAEYFDGLVVNQGTFNPFADSAWRRLADRFEEWVPPTAAMALLDVGCGTGASHAIYRGRATRYVGIDLSARSIEAAREREPNVEWQTADACALPFSDGTFDVVAFSSVLHHIPDFERAVREAARVVRPGGAIFAFDPNLLHPGMLLLRHPKSPLYMREGVTEDECPMLPSKLRRGFSAAGLAEIRQRAMSGLAYREVGPRAVNSALGLFNAVDWAWEAVGLGRLFGSFVLTFGRRPMSDDAKGLTPLPQDG